MYEGGISWSQDQSPVSFIVVFCIFYYTSAMATIFPQDNCSSGLILYLMNLHCSRNLLNRIDTASISLQYYFLSKKIRNSRKNMIIL